MHGGVVPRARRDTSQGLESLRAVPGSFVIAVKFQNPLSLCFCHLVIVASFSALGRTGGLTLQCLGSFPLTPYFRELKGKRA